MPPRRIGENWGKERKSPLWLQRRGCPTRRGPKRKKITLDQCIRAGERNIILQGKKKKEDLLLASKKKKGKAGPFFR